MGLGLCACMVLAGVGRAVYPEVDGCAAVNANPLAWVKMGSLTGFLCNLLEWRPASLDLRESECSGRTSGGLGFLTAVSLVGLEGCSLATAPENLF